MSRDSTGARATRGLPALLYASGIFYGGVIDIGRLPETPAIPADKLLHALVFLGFEVLLELALLELKPRSRRALAVCLAFAVGALLELVQAALPHRSAELLDCIADTIGAFLGAALVLLASRLFSGSARVRPGEG